MWTQVQKMLVSNGKADKMPPRVPLRKPSLPLDTLGVGSVIHFSAACPLPPLSNAQASIIGVKQYRFGLESIKTFQLYVNDARNFYLTIAEDDQGNYLSLSRALEQKEQDVWFGRDALSFFTEPSTAKTIRCKADLMIEGDWAAARYSKTVDWVEGSITQSESTRHAREFHYNLLVNESGEKALEIEHEDANGENRVYVTVYRPIEDIKAILAKDTKPATQPAAPAETPLFREPAISSEPPAQPKQRPDFRRLMEDVGEIHIERTVETKPMSIAEEHALPSFLTAREGNYLSLDHVIPPEAERVRVGMSTAHQLIDQALRRKVRVRDILRETLGLESALSEEVIFELPLTDEDYRTLAMRYKLRPDHRIEIRSRLEEELQQKLTNVAKP